ncbi:hypothetical protein C0989_008596 [Termitomyces sp. Mn162]|nr:hypothetical protein C0989_008596 [Termitomyces sp. Mn162]
MKKMNEISIRLGSTVNATPMPPIAPSMEFIPLILAGAANSTSPASISLCTWFPDIEVVVIMAIIMHEFQVANLHKLDPTNYNKDTAYTFNSSTNQFEVSYHAAKEYKTPFSILVPLNHYLCVLSFHLPKSDTIPFVFHQSMVHILELIAVYEWSAVYNYHSVFFNYRHAKMTAGDYSGWGRPTSDLLDKHVYGHRKPTPPKAPKTSSAEWNPSNPGKVCHKFNKGKCIVIPCPWSCPHSCSTCGKTNHGKHSHKD